MADQQTWLNAWYQGRWWLYLLLPVAWLLSGIARLRRCYLSGRAQPLPVPVIVVGNVAIGGTGKTPLIIAMVQYLQDKGYRPGVISRGYGGLAPHYPFDVLADTQPSQSGDEPLLIARETGCPVVVGSDRNASARHLLERYDCDVILSDDGMQHYKLARQFEICVVDGARQMGNGLCIPAGPLREPPSRLREVDHVVINGGGQLAGQSHAAVSSMSLVADHWIAVADGAKAPIDQPPWLLRTDESASTGAESVYAITGIGNPQRFFNTLESLGVKAQTRAFPDHHPFTQQDLQYARQQVLLMTAKDAVKCQNFADRRWWYLSIAAQLDQGFWQHIDSFMENFHGQ